MSIANASQIPSYAINGWIIFNPKEDLQFELDIPFLPSRPLESTNPNASSLQMREVSCQCVAAENASSKTHAVAEEIFRKAIKKTDSFLQRTATHHPFTTKSYRHLLEKRDRIQFDQLSREQEVFLRFKFECCKLYYFASKPNLQLHFNETKALANQYVGLLDDLPELSEEIEHLTHELIAKIEGWTQAYIGA